MKTATLDRLHGIALIALMSCRHSTSPAFPKSRPYRLAR